MKGNILAFLSCVYFADHCQANLAVKANQSARLASFYLEDCEVKITSIPGYPS